jgi:hypothetical protein
MDFAGKCTYISKKKKAKIQKMKNKNDIIQNDVIKEDIEEENKEMKETVKSVRRHRSRSNSLEKIKDECLDNVYSDEEEQHYEAEDLNVKMAESPFIINQNKKSVGMLDKVKNFFSFSEKKQESPLKSANIKPVKGKLESKPKQQLYNISQKLGAQNVEHQQEVDFNVLTFKYNFLNQKVSYATGDPTICKECEAILNVNSKLTNTEINNKFLWICEFCDKENEIYLEQEEIPKEENVDYFVQSMSQINKGVKDMNYNDEQTVIFCFDVSGSMCVTEPLVGKHSFKGVRQDKYNAELMKFSDGSDQFYQGGSRNTTYVSRLQCLQGAIESNLNDLQKACPNRKIGFVVFNNEVVGIGDGSKPEVKINGNNLNEFEAVQKIGEENSGIISRSLKDTSETLLKHLYSIEETGQTALGPAILFSISLIDGSVPGSKIVLCTDGISNIGLGSLENITTKEEFDKAKQIYESLGQMAKNKGIMISLITFQGEESKIEILSQLCEMTGGDIIKVKPTEILTQFSNLLTSEVIATNVKISVKLHKLMSFRNESLFSLKHDGSTLVKDIGNVTDETETYFEYCFKPSEDIINKYPGIDLDKIEEIPFQSKIEYTSKLGDKCIRVITKMQKVSSDKEEIAKDAKYEILSVNAMKKSSQLAKEGNYRGAQVNAYAWKQFIKSNAQTNNQAFENYSMFNKNMTTFNNHIQKNLYQDVINNNINNYEEFNMMENNENNKQERTINRTDNISSEIHTLNNMNFSKAKKK